jgi:hypothetical protein
MDKKKERCLYGISLSQGLVNETDYEPDIFYTIFLDEFACLA